MISDKVVLGTVQLGLAYGRRAGKPLLERAAAHDILDAAWATGIRTLDTAEAYGGAVGVVSEWVDRRGVRGEVAIVTKARVDDERLIEERMEAALCPFAGVRSLTLLSHGCIGGPVWQRVLGAAGHAGAIAGQSVYGADELRAALREAGVKRVQAPGNVFDESPWRARGDSTARLDVRSVYLQGVLLDPPDIADRRAPGAGPLAGAVQEAAAAFEQDPAALLVAAVATRLSNGDRIVVGVDSARELDVIARALRIPIAVADSFRHHVLQRVGPRVRGEILDPRQWPR